jgi:hypothetical protein
MNRTENDERDLLREFINPGNIEKAPEGFTEKVMSEITLQTCNKIIENRHSKYIVPFVAAGITATLTVAAILAKSNSLLKPEFKLPATIDINLPAIDFSKYLNFSLPSIIGYIFIGMLLLGIFDKGLFNLFHHRRELNH